MIDSGVGVTEIEQNHSMPRPTESRGRGIALMEHLMDQIQFGVRAEAGTVVHLHKRLNLTDASPLWGFASDGNDQ